MTPPVKSGVVALVVSRGAEQVAEVVEAAAAQSLRPDEILLLDCVGDGSADAHSCRIIDTVGARTLGDAIRSAQRFNDDAMDSARWWWILHDDSIPESTCLEEQWEVADRGRTIGAVGPKQVSEDGTALLEVGIFATASARRLERIAPGEIDQGQYDSTSDVLAVGTAGMLIDPETWKALGGTDPVLGPFGDGLDLGRRLHLAGRRVVVAPRARLRHARRSFTPGSAGVDTAGTADSGINGGRAAAKPEDASFAARRFAQLYNWAKAVPAWTLPLLMAWLLVWSPIRMVARLVTGASHLALAEITAWGRLIAATPHLISARFAASRSAVVPMRSLAGLHTSRRELAEGKRLISQGLTVPDGHIDPLITESVSRYRRSSAAALAMVIVLTALISAVWWWGSASNLVGAAWKQLPASWNDLWEAAWATWIPGGDGTASIADPLLIVIAAATWPLHLVGVSPTTAATWFMIAATPLAALSAWVFARGVTRNTAATAATSLVWAFLPALTISQTQGRIGAVLFHIVLPLAAASWMRMASPAPPLVVDAARGTVNVERQARTGSHARAALAAGIATACIPWFIVVAAAASLTRAFRQRSITPVLLVIPSALVIAPFAARAITTRNGWKALLASGGGSYADAGTPAWAISLGAPAVPAWTPWLAASLIVGGLLLIGALIAAMRSALSQHERLAAPALTLGATAIAAAVAASRITVGIDAGAPTTAWTSPMLSIAAVSLISAILIQIPSAPPWDGPAMSAWSRSAMAVVLMALVAGVGAIGGRIDARSADDGLSAYERLSADHVSSPSSPLIAAVSEQGENSLRAGRVLVVLASDDLTNLTVRQWRHAGPALTDSSAITRLEALNAAGAPDDATTELAALALTLASYPDEESVKALADHGIDSILVPDVSAGAGALSEAFDRAVGLERVGATDAGLVWRVRPNGLQTARARVITADTWAPLDAAVISAWGRVDEAAGLILLAERADPGWRATLDGAPLEGMTADNGWAQAFAATGGGQVTITHTRWWTRPWRFASLGVLALTALGAIPWRRKQ